MHSAGVVVYHEFLRGGLDVNLVQTETPNVAREGGLADNNPKPTEQQQYKLDSRKDVLIIQD